MFKLFAENDGTKNNPSPFFWICWPNQFFPKEDVLSQSNSPAICCLLLRCLIFSNHVRHQYQLKHLGVTWIQLNSLTPCLPCILSHFYEIILEMRCSLSPQTYTNPCALTHTQMKGITGAHLSVLVCERCFPTTGLKICALLLTLNLTAVWFIAHISSAASLLLRDMAP